MSMFRPHWPLVAALGLGIGFPVPADPPGDRPELPRLNAQRDSSFFVADSVRAMLTRVNDLVVDPDGSVYLADAGLAAILELGPQGDFRRTIGRRGSGPGEFHSVFAVGFYRDSLWALDPGQVRLTFFPLKGPVSAPGAATIPFGIYAMSSGITRPQAVSGVPTAVLPDGSLLVEERQSDSARRPVQGLLLRTRRSLEIVDTLARMTINHSEMVFTYRDGETHLGQPFGDDPIYAASADGQTVLTVDREASRSQRESTFRVTLWRGGTPLPLTRVIRYRPSRLRREVVEQAMRSLLADLEGARTPVTADSIRRQLFRPDYFPPVESARVARDGSIWLRVRFADGPHDGSEWLQLSPHGFELARLSLPPGFQLLEADRGAIWGVLSDSLGVPQVVRYLVTGRNG